MQLALVGSMATDDPEGWEFFQQHLSSTPTATRTSRSSTTSTTSARSRSTPSSRRPTCCMQKSIREGFGLTVTEALWKGRPMIGGDVGGIPLQIEDGDHAASSSTRRARRRSARSRCSRTPSSAKRLGRAGKEHAREHFLTPRLLRDWLRPLRRAAADPAAPCTDTAPARSRSWVERPPLVDRLQPGPGAVRARRGGQRIVRRGGGGLVTALTGLVAHRERALDRLGDDRRGRRRRPRGGRRPGLGRARRASPTTSAWSSPTPVAYDRFYNVIANPILWFIQHYLWDLSNAPDIRREEADAWDDGYQVVNDDLADAVLRGRSTASDEPLVMVHDYHLYTCPALIREARPDAFLHHFVHIPWTAAGRLADPARPDARARSTAACSPTTSSASTPRAYCRNFLHCCRELMELEVDFERGAVRPLGGREIWVRAYPLRDRRRARSSGSPPPRRSRATRRSCCGAAATT